MSDAVQNSIRYVVKERHAGAVLPGKREEMERDVYLTSGAEVGGGVFGNNVQVEGTGVRVTGAVYARGSLKVTIDPGYSGDAQAVDFKSVVTARDSILIEDHFPARTRFYADVFADQINISNAIVRGNIYAKRATIKNSIVLGGVFCSGKLTLKNVILSTFRAREVALKPELILFYPFAMAEEPIEIDFIAKSLSFTNLLKMSTQEATDKAGVVFIEQDDVVEVSDPEDDSDKSYHLLSLGTRILDMEELKSAFKSNVQFLEMISLGDHLKASAKHAFENDDLHRIENRLFQMLRQPPDKELKHTTSIDQIAQRDSLNDFINSFIRQPSGADRTDG